MSADPTDVAGAVERLRDAAAVHAWGVVRGAVHADDLRLVLDHLADVEAEIERHHRDFTRWEDTAERFQQRALRAEANEQAALALIVQQDERIERAEAALRAIQAEHYEQPVQLAEGASVCGICGTPWPCDTRLFTDAALAEETP